MTLAETVAHLHAAMTIDFRLLMLGNALIAIVIWTGICILFDQRRKP